MCRVKSCEGELDKSRIFCNDCDSSLNRSQKREILGIPSEKSIDYKVPHRNYVIDKF